MEGEVEAVEERGEGVCLLEEVFRGVELPRCPEERRKDEQVRKEEDRVEVREDGSSRAGRKSCLWEVVCRVCCLDLLVLWVPTEPLHCDTVCWKVRLRQSRDERLASLFCQLSTVN